MKKNIRQILSSILVGVMTFGMLPTTAPTEVSAETTATTDLFNGNATYLLQDRFNGAMSNEFGEGTSRAVLSGWDVDYRGGNVYKSGDDLMVVDTSNSESITMDHKLMKHTGDNLVLETAFKYVNSVADGFYYEVFGEGDTSLKLVVEGGYICIQRADGRKTKAIRCNANTFYHIKAEFSTSINKVNLWINGQVVGEFDYIERATSIDEIKIGTGKEQMAELVLKYVYVYVNYLVNETFMSAPTGYVPDWWTTSSGSIVAAPGAPYPADPNGFSLSSKNLSRRFSPANGKVSLGWSMFIPSSGASGFAFTTKSSDFRSPVSFEVDGNGNFVINGQDIDFSYKNNVWYKIELQVDTETHLTDVYINNVLRKENVPFLSNEADIFYIDFINNGSSQIILDNVLVHKTFEASDFEDYPTVDETPKSDINIGMVIYPMWREGVHYGWDLITPYEERTPYLGYYTGGSREVADWDNKWLLEHGFDHAIFPFARPDITAGGQPSFSVRGEALHDGYLNSEYKDQLDFAIMLTNPLDDSYDDASDFTSNVTPYLVEHYLKNPSYKSVDNRLLVYCYNPKGFSDYLGGDSALVTALESINEEAKKIENQNGGKYDGITFICDISSGGGLDKAEMLASSCSFGSYVYKWRYTWGSDQYTNIVNGIKTDYNADNTTVASIPMGFDNTPWKYNEVGIIDPAGVQQICDAVVENKKSNDPNIIVLTCWDEWGEGHFFAPSNIHGFDYLNVVRKTFTSSGEKTDEDRPTEDAIRRMGVLHPEDRQILKIKKDRVTTAAEELKNLKNLGTVSVKNIWGSASGCDRSRSYPYTYTITGSPATVTYSGLSSYNIDASKITAVRIKGYAQNSSTMVLYLRTSSKNYDDAPLMRLEGKCDGGTTTVDTILFPSDIENFKGTVTGMRFNPAANTSNGSKFYLEEVEFYTGKMRTTLTIDDKEVDLVSPVETSDTTYIPAYKLLLDLNAYVLWDKNTQTLTAEQGGVTLKLKAGSKTMQVNGESKTLSYAPYYKEGNLFIPYQGVLEELGYRVRYNTSKDNIGIYTDNYETLKGNEYIKNSVNNGLSWDFNIDGDAEKWAGSGVLKPMVVRDGMLELDSITTDPIITIDNLNIPTSKARYAIVRIKKTDKREAGMLRLYESGVTNGSGVVYNFTLSPSDEIQEFVFDLATGYNKSFTDKYENLSKITNLRLDPMDNTGKIYIDQIRITDTLPTEDFNLKAYAFEGTNMLQLDTEKTGFTYTNAMNSEGNSTKNILPATETVDGYSNVIKVIPMSGANTGLLSLEEVYYKGNKQKVDTVCNDNRVVKVSFWYKGIGDCKSLRFENRQGDKRDGEEFFINDISNSEWKYFEDYIDMSNEEAAKRWFSLRVITGGDTAKDGVYLRDYKLVCLDETTPVTSAGNDTVAIKVEQLDTNIRIDRNKVKIYFAEYDAKGKMIGTSMKFYPNIIEVSTGDDTEAEVSKHYYLKPTADTKKINCILWNGFAPMSKQLTLTKN